MIKRVPFTAAGSVVLIAAVLRLVYPGMYEFWWDEVLNQYRAMRLALHGDWVWVGNPSTSGLYHSPFGVYFTALPYFVTPTVIGPRVLYGVYSLLTVVFALVFLRRNYGWTAALLAGLLIAVNPLAIYWSRFAWHPNIAPPCIILWIMTGVIGYYEGKRWAQIVHWLALSAIIQASLALVAIGPVSVGLVIAHRAWNKTTLIAVGLAGLTLIPWGIGLFGVYLDWFTGPPANGLGRSASNIGLPSLQFAADHIGHLMGRYAYNFGTLEVSDHPATWWPDQRLNILLGLHTVIVLAGAAYLLRKRGADRFLVVALCWPLLFLFYQGAWLFDFYMMPTVFAADLIFGITFARLWQWKRVSIVIALVLIAGQAWLTIALLDREHRSEQVYSLSEFQADVENWLEQGDEIVLLDEKLPAESWLVSLEWRMKWELMAKQYPIRIVTEPQGFPVAPQGEILASVDGGDLIPALVGAANLNTGSRDYRWRTVQAADVLAAHPITVVPEAEFGERAAFGDFVHVIGIVAEPHSDQEWPLVVVWEPLKTVEQRYNFSVRVAGADGSFYKQADGLALEAGLWRVGDTVFTRFIMPPVPDNVAWYVDLLFYAWENIENVPIANHGGAIMKLSPP